jgi:hypothetical protein
MGALKSRARRSKAAIVAYKIYANWRLSRRYRRGEIETQHGSTHRGKTVAESLAYILAQFRDYLRYSGLREQDLRGKRVLELGPGDNAGVALKFLAAGAARVVCVDKFSSTRDPAQQRQIYLALRESLPRAQRSAFEAAIRIEREVEIVEERLLTVHGLGLEESAASVLAHEPPFDLIVSRAVIEEIYDPEPVFRASDSLLAPGGYVLHKIDLGDYGMFSDSGMHPLTFLTIPEFLYRRMARDSGIPNRKRMSYYCTMADTLGYDSKVFVTSILGEGCLEPHKELGDLGSHYSERTRALATDIRARLGREFRRLSDEELFVTGIFLVSRKPGPSLTARTSASVS